MKLIDLIVLVPIVLGVLYGINRMISNAKSGGCSGCSQCSLSSTCQKSKTE